MGTWGRLHCTLDLLATLAVPERAAFLKIGQTHKHGRSSVALKTYDQLGYPGINDWPFSFVSKGQSIFSVTQIMMTLTLKLKRVVFSHCQIQGEG